MGNAQYAETDLLRAVTSELRAMLPRRWTLELSSVSPSESRADGLLVVGAPGGATLEFALLCKAASSVGPVANLVNRAQQLYHATNLPVLLAVKYANPALREACGQHGISYVDTTGWVSVDGDGPPGLVLRAQGASRSPVTRPTSINRLDGSGAARVIRALWLRNANFPVKVRELAEESGVAAGTVSKVLPALAEYGAVDRNSAGRVVGRNRRLLLQRWTQDYNFRTSNREVAYLLAPRGLGSVEELIRSALPPGLRVGSTGPSAVRNELVHGRLPSNGEHLVLPLTTAAFYTDDIPLLAGYLKLVSAPQPAAANVIVAQPRDLSDGDLLPTYNGSPAAVQPVPRPQVLADLLTMGGRYPELAEQILATQVDGDTTP